MIHQGWKSGRGKDEPARPMVVKRAETSDGRAVGGFVERMLGQESVRAVSGAFAAPAPRRGTEPQRTLRMKAVEDAGTPLTRPAAPSRKARKGSIRVILALLLLGAGLWKGGSAYLGSRQTLAEVAPAPRAEEPKGRLLSFMKSDPAQEAENLRRLPLVDAGGKALALWRSESGVWFAVNSRGGLSRLSDEQARARLELPRLNAGRLRFQAKGSGKALYVDLKEGDLSDILPLRDSLAAEVESLRLDGGKLSLRTHRGTLAELGEGDYARKLVRLEAVLADLAARKKRASLVDLRFEESAVVRLAAR